jgi:hypothetical protein
MSQTVGTILFTLRVAARVESSAVYLLQHAEGGLALSLGPLGMENMDLTRQAQGFPSRFPSTDRDLILKGYLEERNLGDAGLSVNGLRFLPHWLRQTQGVGRTDTEQI